jgi:hypothetical protein
MSWKDFVLSKYISPREGSFTIRPDVDLIQCSAAVEETLRKPGLSPADFKWCEWALSSSGGKVQVWKLDVAMSLPVTLYAVQHGNM